MKFFPLKKKKDFLKVLKSGKRVYTSTLTIVYLPASEPRFAVCVGKKYGKSVQRNRIKRLLRESFRYNTESIKEPCSILLLPKVAEEYSFEKFKKDIGIAFKKERLCQSSGS